jgi:uncharacterized membrane protein YccF (DUF307 family)
VLQTSVYTTTTAPRHGCLAQALWFVFVGWWLGLIWTGIAWLAMNTIILIPLGVVMLNEVPNIIALRGRRTVEAGTGRTVEPQQVNILIRAAYFLLLGWWLSGVWLTAAYIASATIILMPIGIKMFDLTPMVASLRMQ